MDSLNDFAWDDGEFWNDESDLGVSTQSFPGMQDFCEIALGVCGDDSGGIPPFITSILFNGNMRCGC